MANLLAANPGLKESSARHRAAALHAVLAAEVEVLARSMVDAFTDGITSSASSRQCMGWRDVLTAFAAPQSLGRTWAGPGAQLQRSALEPVDAARLLASAQARLEELYE